MSSAAESQSRKQKQLLFRSGGLAIERGNEARSPTTSRAANVLPILLVIAACLAVLAYRGQLDLVSVAILSAALVTGFALLRTRVESSSHVVSAQEAFAKSDDLLSNIPDPVILVDSRIVVRDANRAAADLLPGLKADHPLSFALRAPDVLDGIGKALDSGQPQTVEYRQRIPTERTFEVHISPVKPLQNGDSERLRALLFFRDLTSARRLENMRVDFVANASHELRTPLASLLGFIDTLQGRARDDAAARERFLEIMREQALRMSRLIEDLLSLSRIELRMHVRPNSVVDLLSIARELADSMAPVLRERGLELSLRSDDEPYEILGDRDELLRAVENLLDNAVKYGASGKKIDIRLTRMPANNGAGSTVELEVRDYGPGIAPEHLPRLTERFYRADVAESRQKGGTGLGLALVKHIAVRHRGRLQIESEPGKGAAFRVSFPQAPPTNA